MVVFALRRLNKDSVDSLGGNLCISCSGVVLLLYNVQCTWAKWLSAVRARPLYAASNKWVSIFIIIIFWPFRILHFSSTPCFILPYFCGFRNITLLFTFSWFFPHVSSFVPVVIKVYIWFKQNWNQFGFCYPLFQFMVMKLRQGKTRLLLLSNILN